MSHNRTKTSKMSKSKTAKWLAGRMRVVPRRASADGDVSRLLAAGLEHQEAGRLAEAEQLYGQVLKLDACHAEALHLQGMVAFQSGRYDRAAELIRKAIVHDGRDSRHYSNLGIVLQTQGQLAEAVACYERALEVNPRSAAAHSNLGEALQAQGRLEEAAASFERALAIDPGMAVVHSNLGNVRQAQGRFEEALAGYQRALELQPQLAMAHVNLGNLRGAQGRLAEAEASYERALGLNPVLDMARFNASLMRLLQGDFAAGLPGYEGRWRLNKPRDFAQPQWRGEPLHGARILLHAEQGLGDTLQMLRYLPMVRAAGGEVILEVQEPLRRLVAQLPGVGEGDLFTPGEPLPDFAWHCPWMSLPLAFGTTVESIPAKVPYLSVTDGSVKDGAVKKAKGLAWPATGLRVGLVWAGSLDHRKDKFRSIPLALLEPVLRTRGVQFFSLQVGPAAAQLTAAQLRDAPWPVTDLAPVIEDMADTAALMMELDLILTVDTAVAHLAGALARPVWLLLPLAPDWRWLLEREDSPWYPTMRLFRQAKLGDWGPVIERVRRELAEKVGAGSGTRKKANGNGCYAGALTASAAMPAWQPVVASGGVECKVCGGLSQLFGVVDFHKSCREAQGLRLALSGIPVYYRRCRQCGFAFTDAFDGWPREEFERRIYNADYVHVDPDFVEVRPAANARLVAESFPAGKVEILDYGGGNGLLAERLRGEGFSAATYDPFSSCNELPETKFDLVTCFEVMEHVPQPRDTVAEMVGLLKEDGAVLFSTLLQPAEFEKTGLSWWYAAPRNGHISLYTQAALARLFKAHGMRVGSFSAGLHIAYARVPGFARHLNLPE